MVVLVVLLAAAVAGLVMTRDSGKQQPEQTKQAGNTTNQIPLVNLSPLRAAQTLASLATSPEEQPLAREALRLGDHAVDLAFAAALREAAEHPATPDAATREIHARLQKAQKLLQSDQQRVPQLTAEVAKATGDKKDALDYELELTRAQVELDRDEVDDAKQDLIRAGGDVHSRIQSMVEEHEATAHGNAAASAANASAAPTDAHGLIPGFEQWYSLHQKQNLLHRAKMDAETAGTALTGDHEVLEARISAQAAKSPELARHAADGTQAVAGPPAHHSREEAAALLSSTKRLSADQKTLVEFDKRIEDEKELADVYQRWSEIIEARQRATIHRALIGVLLILVITLIALYFDTWMDQFFGKLTLGRGQLHTLRTIARVALQVVALLLILLVIFGPPTQLATFLGLAGAGLTVALKDFILGFFGWFVLMGKNGIRLGDWVEINGVSGEVVEIGLFHTVLLETGNWNDAGHPTGRRVTFANSFAIGGHFFNFSTSGQWLWDELQVVLPAGEDPYPVIEAIQKNVTAETSENVRLAEQEWRRATRSRGMNEFTAEPAVNVRPVIGGIQVVVRYITRANERYQLRSKLYQSVVDLLGKKNLSQPAPLSAQTRRRKKLAAMHLEADRM